MPTVRVRVPAAAHPSWDDLRAELAVPTAFPPDAEAEAEAAAKVPADALPGGPREDLTGLPFLTVDPEGSLDLDQAMCLERVAGGFRVRYAIADVAAFVRPGGPLDAETHRRAETSYFPDLRVPLPPPVLAEGAASLLADQVRPAVVWNLDLDSAGALQRTDVRRALVRSQRRLDYATVQRAL